MYFVEHRQIKLNIKYFLGLHGSYLKRKIRGGKSLGIAAVYHQPSGYFIYRYVSRSV